MQSAKGIYKRLLKLSSDHLQMGAESKCVPELPACSGRRTGGLQLTQQASDRLPAIWAGPWTWLYCWAALKVLLSKGMGQRARGRKRHLQSIFSPNNRKWGRDYTAAPDSKYSGVEPALLRLPSELSCRADWLLWRTSKEYMGRCVTSKPMETALVFNQPSPYVWLHWHYANGAVGQLISE